MINRFRYALIVGCLFTAGSSPGAEAAATDSPPQKEARGSVDAEGKPTGASLREAFQASVEEYRKSATDPNARKVTEIYAKKMAELYKRLTPAPALPEEAEFHAAKGAAFAKLAKVPADFERAAKEFLEAVSRAPWHGEFHFNQAVCLKSAGQFAQALVSLKMAHLLARDDTERRDALAMRAEIEASQEMAAQEAAGAAAAKQTTLTAQEQRISGTWNRSSNTGVDTRRTVLYIKKLPNGNWELTRDFYIDGKIRSERQPYLSSSIKDFVYVNGQFQYNVINTEQWNGREVTWVSYKVTCTVSADGNSLDISWIVQPIPAELRDAAKSYLETFFSEVLHYSKVP